MTYFYFFSESRRSSSSSSSSSMSGDEAYEEFERTFSARADIIYPDMSHFSRRLATFAHCTTIDRYSHEALARAGFFWTGKSDQTLCFCCGGGIANWNDNVNYAPCITHHIWFPRCPFIRAYALHDFSIADFTASLVQEDDVSATEASATVAAMPRDLLCSICLDARLGVLFRPCNHLASCLTCSDRLVTCPICRTYIDEKINVYL